MPFDHGPNIGDSSERPETITRNTRYGVILFLIYLLFYGTYVGVNAFAPEVMRRTPVAGLNLAILSGFGLIGLAVVLALIYGWLCRAESSANGGVKEARR